MKKYLIKQVYNIDNQLYYDTLKEDLENNFNDSVFIGLNRQYDSINCDIINIINKDILDYNSYDLEVYYHNHLAHMIIDILKPYKKINLKQAIKIEKIVNSASNNFRNNQYQLLCDILSIIYLKQFNYTCMRGYCQDEWIYCFYNSDIDYEYIQYIEAVLFNTGIEICISENKINMDDIKDYLDNNIDYECYYDYLCDYYKEDDIKQVLSKNIGCGIDEIAFYRIDDIKEIKTIKLTYKEV